MDGGRKLRGRKLEAFIQKLAKVREAGQYFYNETVAEARRTKGGKRSGHAKWLDTMTKSGTLGDRISAMAIRVQDDAFGHLDVLTQLCAMAEKNDRRTSSLAVDALKDLWQTALLPEERGLVALAKRPISEVPDRLLHASYGEEEAPEAAPEQYDDGGRMVIRLRGQQEGKRRGKAVKLTDDDEDGGAPKQTAAPPAKQSEASPAAASQSTPGEVTGRVLAEWYFEDALKKQYNQFLDVMERQLHDSLAQRRHVHLMTVYELLLAHPEQERRLLGILCNKLGDPLKKMASKAVYLLQELCSRHPGMKRNVLLEVTQMLHRPGLTDRARYYAVIFLTQVLYDRRDSDDVLLARHAVCLYVRMFRQLYVDAASEAERKAARGSKQSGKARRHAKKQRSKKGQQSSLKQAQSAELAVHSKLCSALLTGIFRAFPYTRHHIDEDDKQEEELEGRTALTAAYTLDTLLAEVNVLLKFVYARLNLYVAVQAMHVVGMLVKAQEMDPDSVSAGDADRESQLSTLPRRFRCALYDLLACAQLPTVRKPSHFFNLLYQSMKRDPSEDSVLAFVHRLLHCASTASRNPSFMCAALLLLGQLAAERPFVRSFLMKAADTPGTPSQQDDTGYNATHKSPEFSNASATAPWQLAALLRHFHPTVSTWAAQLVAGQPLSYGGDPLGDFTLAAFLDKFVFKNPKKLDGKQRQHKHARSRISSQFLSTLQTSASSSNAQLVLQSGVPVTAFQSREFRQQTADAVAPDEQFYHRYFTARPDDSASSDPDLSDMDSSEEEAAAQYFIERKMAELNGGEDAPGVRDILDDDDNYDAFAAAMAEFEQQQGVQSQGSSSSGDDSSGGGGASSGSSSGDEDADDDETKQAIANLQAFEASDLDGLDDASSDSSSASSQDPLGKTPGGDASASSGDSDAGGGDSGNEDDDDVDWMKALGGPSDSDSGDGNADSSDSEAAKSPSSSDQQSKAPRGQKRRREQEAFRELKRQSKRLATTSAFGVAFASADDYEALLQASGLGASGAAEPMDADTQPKKTKKQNKKKKKRQGRRSKKR